MICREELFMKKCIRCGCDLDDNIIFCPNCGAAQPEPDYGDANQSYQNYSGYVPSYSIRPRNIVLCIIFTIITFGIYGLYWIYKLAEEFNDISESQDRRPGTSPGLVILFGIITCGIYMIYFWYKIGKQASKIQDAGGCFLDDMSIACMILSIFGLEIISSALMQNLLNQYLRGYGIN